VKRIIAGLLTLALLLLVAWVALRRGNVASATRRDDESLIESAESRVHALLRCARDGDVSTYLAAFDGSLRQRLEREISERGLETFATDLRRAARLRKSHSVFAPEPEGDDVASVAVETVYPDRIERQTFRLGRRAQGWLVTEVTSVQGHEPQSKFGSPASFQEPEGVPVQPKGAPVESPDDSG
jgi:hypothetical protein